MWGQRGLCRGRGREVTARRGGRAGVLTRAARRSSDAAVAAVLCGGDAEGVCPYAVGEEVSWTGGESMRPRGTHGHASAPWLRVNAGRTTPESRRRSFGHVSSASGKGGARLRHRALGMGIPGGATTGSSRAVASDDGMPRRTAADAMTQGGRRTHGRPCGVGW
jgi:hypothetical protein